MARYNAQLALGTGPGVLLRVRSTGYRVHRAPTVAAVDFGNGLTLPLVNVGAAVPSAVTAPNGYITSPWFTSSSSYNQALASFSITSGWWLFSHTTLFYWGGSFALADGQTATAYAPAATPIPAPIARRWWIDGNEMPAGGEGPTGGVSSASYDAGVDPGSLGIAIRNTTATEKAHQFVMAAATAGHPQSWERMTVRVRAFPTAATEFWRSHYNSEFFAGASANFKLLLSPTGQLLVNRVTTAGSDATVAASTSAIALNTRTKIDILHKYYATASVSLGDIEVYVNGALVASSTAVQLASSSLPNGKHGQSSVGVGGSANILELDIDNWICADVPLNRTTMFAAWNTATTYWPDELIIHSGTVYRSRTNNIASTPPSFPADWTALGTYTAAGPDWIRGSTVRRIVPTAFAGTNVWAAAAGFGDASGLGLRAPNSTVEGLSNAVGAALLAVTTDSVNALNVPQSAGVAGMVVGLYSQRGAASGTLGYKIGAASAVLTAITESTSLAWSTVIWNPSNNDLTTIPTPSAIELHYTKGAGADTARVKHLAASVELLGYFDTCDLPSQATLTAAGLTVDATALTAAPASKGAHMAPYPNTPWSRVGAPPLSPLVIKTGTYTGNGTGQDLTFKAPVNMLWIRPITGDVGGVKWWSSQVAPHVGMGEGFGNLLFGELKQDLTFTPASSTADQQMQFVVHLAGGHTQVNSNGVSYAYVAWCDPGARFSLAGATVVRSGSLPVARSLADSAFTPEFLFVLAEDAGTSSTTRLYSKGAGHTSDGVSKIDTGTEITGSLSIAAGSLTWKSGIVNPSTLDQLSFIGFRRADGNADANQAAVMSVGTYTGDGNASRTISCGTAGLRPLFAFVQPINGNPGYQRDPSHTGTNATATTGGASATAITAGSVDSFAVGITLNTNTVVYNYFVLWGSSTAGNGGWSIDGEFTPVASDSPIDATYLTTPVVVSPATTEEEEVDTTDPGLLDTDIATACVASSTRLVNIALSRIGVTKAVTSLATDLTPEAAAARTVYKTELDATLRDFPWPFATRYATLALVAGTTDTPVNDDWTFSYRTPARSLFIRRIVNPDNARSDREPVAFRLGQDDTGDLVYCNEPGDKIADGEDVNVEYTARVDCPARVGDALFRSAAAWRLAAALVMPLARDEKLVTLCEKKYQEDLRRARNVSVREQEQQHLESNDDAEWLRGR